ncbi:MAG: ABC transporter permease [Saprospiraceae bacterium]
MNKLGLIIKREYLTRVTRRSFILATILTPLGFAVFFIVVGLIFQYQSDDSKRIAVIDEGNIMKGSIPDEPNLYFKFEKTDLTTLRKDFEQFDYDGILVLPSVKDLFNKQYTAYYYSPEPPTLDVETLIRDRVDNSLRDYKIEGLKLERKQLEALDTRIDIEPEPIDPEGEDATNLTGAIAAGIGSIMGIIMYMTVFIYGMMVMRSVMEEKTSRIVEVMISNVKPFQLMLGKIIGVGAVGLTQVAIWAVLIPATSFLINLIFGFDASQSNAAAATEINAGDTEALIGLAIQEFRSQNWWLILPLFILYFLGGYFLYSSLFAAVGSAMGDDLGEGQALTLPITIPVIIAFYIMFVAVQAPNSSLAVWSSIFPLFSPIVMPARLAFNPPLWQVATSILILAATCIFFVWLSGRIYRVGILMYGKKVTMKELGKWLFYKD